VRVCVSICVWVCVFVCLCVWLCVCVCDCGWELVCVTPHAKSWLIGKDSDAGRDWGQEEKGTTEDEMAGWHHWLNGRESGWTPQVGDGQGAWSVAIHGVTRSWTRLSDWTGLNWETSEAAHYRGNRLYWNNIANSWNQ